MTVTAVDPWTATVLDAIGDTPLIRVDGIWVKLEFLNPSGSIKARIAKYMIERAEREGLLRPGDTIVEASSGNTGNAMSMVAAVKGYRMLVVMPNGMSRERLAISRAFGAEVMTIGDFHVNDALAKCRELGAPAGILRAAAVRQRVERRGEPHLARPGDPAPAAGRRRARTLSSAGSAPAARIVGVGQAFREVNPACRVVAVEPNESCTLMCGEVGKHLIEGISDGFVPGIIERHRARHRRDRRGRLRRGDRGDAPAGPRVRPVRRAELRRAPDRRPASCERGTDLEHVVTFFCDEGEKYINDYFL